MENVAAVDPDFNVMVKFINGEEITAQALGQAIQGFRRRISLSWFSQFFRGDLHLKAMTAVWKVLFQLVENDDPGIRISVFSALGALLFALGTFVPRTTVLSFLEAVQDQVPSTHRSIAVVACFCHVSRYVSAINATSFVSKLPIVHHLGVDLGDYLKYLPKLFSTMALLDIEFQRTLLRTLLINFGKTPTISFVAAIVEIVKHKPDVLFPDLMSYVKVKSLKSTMLMLTSSLLKNPAIAKFSNESGRRDLFHLAISSIEDETAGLNEFEEACRSLAILVNYIDKSEYKEGMNQIKESLSKRDVPQHMKLFVLQITDDIEQLTPCEGDSTSMLSTKLHSLALMYTRTPTAENLAVVLGILWKFANAKGEVYSKYIDALATMFRSMTPDVIGTNSKVRNRLKIMLDSLMNSKCENWVQETALVSLIQSVRKEVGAMLLPGFERIALEKVFEFCFSKQTSLSRAALDAVVNMAKHDVMDIVNSLLYRSMDIWDENKLFRSFEILNRMVNVFGIENFEFFGPFIEEIFVMNRSIKTACEALKFLNRMHSMNQTIYDMCLDLIAKVFKSFTGQDTKMQAKATYYDVPPVRELAETDILSRPFDEQSYLVASIQNSLKYLGRFDVTDDRMSLMVIQTFKCFPKESVRILIKRPSSPYFNSQIVKGIALEILETTSSTSIAASCVHCVSNFAEKDGAFHSAVKLFLEKDLCKKGRDLFYFYSYLLKVDDLDECTRVYKKLHPTEQMRFDFLKFREEHANDDQLFLSWLASFDFNDWPIHDSEFRKTLAGKISLLNPISIKRADLTKHHMTFVSKYRECFTPESIAVISEFDEASFKKLFSQDKVFALSKVENAPIHTSAQLYFKRNEMIDNAPVIGNFLKFSSFSVSQELFDQIIAVCLNQSPSYIDRALRYATDHKLVIKSEYIDMIKEMETPRIRFLLTRYLYTIGGDIDDSDLPNNQNGKLGTRITWFDLVVQKNPLAYFEQIADEYSFACRQSKELCYLLFRYKIPLKRVCEFVKKSVENIFTITKPKQLLYFLRVVQIFFTMLFRDCNKRQSFSVDYAKDLFSVFFKNVSFLATSALASVHIELGYLLTWVPYFKSPDESFVSFFDSFHSHFGHLPAYFPACASCVSFGAVQTNAFTTTAVSHALYSELPSKAMQVLRSAIFILHPSATSTAVNYHTMMYSSTIDVFGKFGRNPVVPQYLANAVQLVASSKSSQLRMLVLPDLVKKCEANKNLAAEKILALVTPQKVSFSAAMKTFISHPTVELGQKLIEIALAEEVIVGCATMMIGNIAILGSNFLTVFIVFKKIYDAMGPEMQEVNKELMCAMIDSVKIGERGDALKSIINGGDLLEGAELASHNNC